MYGIRRHQKTFINIKLFIKENLIISTKTTCCICGFFLDMEATGERVVECKYLFLKHIYGYHEHTKMNGSLELQFYWLLS